MSYEIVVPIRSSRFREPAGAGDDFNGDGRPVVEKDNQPTYPRNDPPSGGLEATPKVFQVWSSVLGSNLVTIGGYTGGTKVFAGGTLIGTANGNSGSRWTTADPVTGTTVRWAGSNGVWEKAAEETEPLGQLVASADPDLDNDPGYDYAARNSAFPQWQCDLPDSFWAEDPNERFRSMPFECQQRVLQDLSAGLDEIYGFSNPNNEPDPGNLDHERSHTASSGPSMALTLAASALQSSWKPKKKPKEGRFEFECPEGTTPQKDKQGNTQCVGVGVTNINVDPPEAVLVNFDKLIKLGEWALENVRLIGFTKAQESQLVSGLLELIMDKRCVDAFRRAKLPTVAEVIRDRGLIWANYDMLRSESNNPKFGLTEGQRKTIIGEERLNGQAITIFELPGPVLTFFKPNAFFDQGSFPTAEVIAHEAIHEVGVRTDTAIRLFLPPVNTGIPNPFAAHDLSSYPYYNDIIEN